MAKYFSTIAPLCTLILLILNTNVQARIITGVMADCNVCRTAGCACNYGMNWMNWCNDINAVDDFDEHCCFDEEIPDFHMCSKVGPCSYVCCQFPTEPCEFDCCLEGTVTEVGDRKDLEPKETIEDLYMWHSPRVR